MKKAMIELLKVKSIVTLMITLTLCCLAVIGKIPPELFLTIAATVFTYYFTRKTNETEEK